ncbi:MAG TPA: tRNA pseudouridine(38-40) synthase TruA [Thermodesulfobacteriota bacterium]|nr:tRNA pseudouridine(38-40) synthase TruA [Thermodesulfobacteriota bacterium]
MREVSYDLVMRNIKLIIEYDGTNYLGWQKQRQSPTVQEVLENTLEKITKEKTKVIGSGRTDSGVHALAQVANFKTTGGMTTSEFQKALNSLLPKDIVIKEAAEVDLNFHAQFDAKSKVYIYRILNRSYPSALERLREWFIPHPLNISLMQRAGESLLGEHDFRAFALSGRAKTTLRTVLCVNLMEEDNGRAEFEVEATGFLRGMVRLIVGTLAQVGRERITPEDFREILESGQRTKFVHSAPPWGLFLKQVKY